MDELLKPFSGQLVNHGSLVAVLKDYSAPNFKIHRWLGEDVLVAMKKGLYIVSPLKSNVPVALPLVANQLYGPSYVSLEYALYSYGMIPERVAQITSVTIKRAKTFQNSLGRFSYQKLPVSYYKIGIDYVKSSDTVAFMIASPEKALCDWLVLTPNLKIYSVKALRDFLLTDLRLDESFLVSLSPVKVGEMASNIKKSKLLNLLADLLEQDQC